MFAPSILGAALPVRVGLANFDRITIKIYKDNTARLEALKAGEFDLMRINSAGDWARRLTGRRFASGELVKGAFENKLPSGFQSFFLNTRRELLKDVRVRDALGLAYDFEWMSRQMFYGAYQRVHGLFGNTACETTGDPSEAELALLKPYEGSLPPGTLGQMAQPPRTDGPDGLRGNLRRAQKLLADAGWTVRDGALRNAGGEPMVLEYLDSSESGVKIVSSWMRNLEKLGITLKVRNVDYALYQQRMDKYDFDIVTLNVPARTIRVRNMPSCSAAPPPMWRGPQTMSVSRARPWMPSSPRWLRPSPSSRCCPPATRWSASSCTATT